MSEEERDERIATIAKAVLLLGSQSGLTVHEYTRCLRLAIQMMDKAMTSEGGKDEIIKEVLEVLTGGKGGGELN